MLITLLLLSHSPIRDHEEFDFPAKMSAQFGSTR